MKKITLLAVLISLTSAGAFAQLGMGLKGGVNLASATIEGENTEGRIGFHFGAFAEFSASDNLAIQPEILFSSQGYENGTEVNIDGGGVSIGKGEQKIALFYFLF